MAQERDFSAADRHELLHLMQKCMAGLIPRYRALAERGQIELSMTPYGHPIVPLLNDFANLRDALPDVPVPEAESYPGGAERARWHLRHGVEVFQRYFGMKPKGVWLSEGGVSEDALAQLDEMGMAWTASGEGVWRSSCVKSGCKEDETQAKRALFSPAQVDGFSTRVFFRDDGLSDLIGFKYSDWHADDAVADFVQHLKNIAGFFGKDADRHVVSVILDGENAWEYYPDNGHHFLDALYASLSSHPSLTVSTFAEQVERTPSRPIKRLAAGSWVYGSFSTWIGSNDKNRGWDYLVAAKAGLRQRGGRRQAERRSAGAGHPPARRVRRFRLVLVVRRLQPGGQRQRLRAAVSDPVARTLSHARRGAACAARRAAVERRRLGGKRRHHAQERLMNFDTHHAGLLLHPTSLPSGTLADVDRWLDFLQAAGFGVWQMLPLGLPLVGLSPYQCASAFAVNPILFPYARADMRSFADWRIRQRHWLEDYARFMVIKEERGGTSWTDWPHALRDRDPQTLAEFDVSHADALKAVMVEQYCAAVHWQGIRAAAAARGIKLFGDMPIFVAHDSADVWAQRDLFLLDASGHPTAVAGVPPDYFSETGQRWGNPHYNWIGDAGRRLCLVAGPLARTLRVVRSGAHRSFPRAGGGLDDSCRGTHRHSRSLGRGTRRSAVAGDRGRKWAICPWWPKISASSPPMSPRCATSLDCRAWPCCNLHLTTTPTTRTSRKTCILIPCITPARMTTTPRWDGGARCPNMPASR